ncbi:trypsin-like serine protease [Streptomyces sp. bgisy154]|uniref:trypsin-like serine protease n=1 Tax=Streptomyces sp. bgisy154 TaxID=3413794 RepID=UPI003D71B4FF
MRHTRQARLAAVATALIAGPVALCAAPASAVTGAPVTDGTFAATAQIIVGDDYQHGCSGVLVDTEWLLTSASCFADDPATSLAVPAGKPALRTTATIGRSDLTGTGGAVRQIVELAPRTDRDVVLARLNRPVTNVTPVALATAAPAAAQQLSFAGYGRTKTEWAPLKLNSGSLTVDSTDATTATFTGTNGAAVCMGDAGGPVLNASKQLVALNSRSFQGGCFGIDATETRTGGVAARVDDLASWIASKVDAVRQTDFNCDGVEDVAVADPGATVGGDSGAGLVRVVYGGGKGTAQIDQDLDWVPGGSEAGDGFGQALDTVDYNEDGCTDLVVGIPSEDLGSVADAGSVQLLFGAPGGLGTGSVKATVYEQGAGNGSLAASTPESGDRTGEAVAAGTTAAGEPYIVIGVPGESLSGNARAGMAVYVHGTTNTVVHQDSTGVPGGVEAGDRFGSAVAADGNYIAVSAPHDGIGGDADAGNVAVFRHTLNSEGRPTPVFGLDQDVETVSGGAEAGDVFGSSLALVAYRPSGSATASDSILMVGSPGEDLTIDNADKTDAGMVHAFHITAAGAVSQTSTYHSGTSTDDVAGTAESGDRFGSTLTAVNTKPRSVSTTSTLKMAVGIPNEALGSTDNAGAVLTFSLLGARGDNDRWLEVGDGDGIPGTPGANQYLGRSIHFTGTHLYVGMPYGPSSYGALYALPLSNVTAGGTVAPVTTYQPGTGGLPAAGARFGYAAR